MDGNVLGKRIKQLREENKMEQKDLARIIDKAESTIGHYERGLREPDFKTLHIIVDHFNVTLDWLTGKSNIRNPYIYIPDEYKNKYGIEKNEIVEYEKFMKQHINAFFMNDEVPEEDKEAIAESVSLLYWKSKKKNKDKE